MRKEMDVEIPGIPNFIKVGMEALPLTSFTEEELRGIGEEWTRLLVLKAKMKEKAEALRNH